MPPTVHFVGFAEQTASATIFRAATFEVHFGGSRGRTQDFSPQKTKGPNPWKLEPCASPSGGVWRSSTTDTRRIADGRRKTTNGIFYRGGSHPRFPFPPKGGGLVELTRGLAGHPLPFLPTVTTLQVFEVVSLSAFSNKITTPHHHRYRPREVRGPHGVFCGSAPPLPFHRSTLPSV